MNISDEKPPKTTLRVHGWRDLPADENSVCYKVADRTGNTFEVWAKGKRRRVLEGLCKAPIYSASNCRISDHVDHLRRDGVDIETTLYRNDDETGRERFGVYTLQGSVSPISEQENAA